MAVLEDIINAKRQEVLQLRSVPLPPLPQGVRRSPSLKRTPGGALNLIAELKYRSPSAGELSRLLGTAERARAYHESGAAMMSVLCDGPFFGGSFEDLRKAKDAAPIPLLCKEFIVDEVQLHYAAAFGASWALLIVRCLTQAELRTLIASSFKLGLTPLVEVHTEAEVPVALEAGATVIGVNARDLDTLKMDSARAARVLDLIPNDVTALHLSGIKTPADIQQLAQTRADGALIGETLMRQDDPRELLTALVSAATPSPSR